MPRLPSSPDPRAGVSRRAALGIAVGGAGVLGVSLSGCDLGDLDRDLGGDPAPAADSPDVALVAGVLAAIDERLAAVVAARAAVPGLSGPLLGLQEMHEAHRAALDTTAPTPSPYEPSTSPLPSAAPPAPTGPPARVLRRLRAAESQHQAALVEASVAARSGALARLLGSVSASVAQHLAVLPTRVAPS